MSDFGEPWKCNKAGTIGSISVTSENKFDMLSQPYLPVYIFHRNNIPLNQTTLERICACVNALAGENPEKVGLWKELEQVIRSMDKFGSIKFAATDVPSILKQLYALEGRNNHV